MPKIVDKDNYVFEVYGFREQIMFNDSVVNGKPVMAQHVEKQFLIYNDNLGWIWVPIKDYKPIRIIIESIY